MNTTQNSTIDIADPLYRLLHYRLKLHLTHVMTIWILINIIQVILIPILRKSSLGIGLLVDFGVKDIQLLLTYFVIQPVTLYVYWKSVTVIPHTFQSLIENGVLVETSPEQFTEFLVGFERRNRARWVNLLVVATVIFIVVVFNLTGWNTHRFQGIYGAYPFNDFQQYALLTPHGLIRFTFVTWVAARGILYIDTLQRLWKTFEADIKPMHPDSSAGLGEIGNRVRETGLMIAAAGLFVGSAIMVNIQYQLGATQLTILWVLIMFYVLLIPAAFFLPVWSTHQAMRRSRTRYENAIFIYFNRVFTQVMEADDPNPETLQSLNNLTNLYNISDKTFPIWPFSIEDVRIFGLSITPLIVFGISLLAETFLTDVLLEILTP